MSDRSASPAEWRPTTAWQLRRIARTFLPVALVGYFVARATGNDLPGWLHLALVPVCLGVGLALFALTGRRRRARSRGIRALAAQRGWAYTPMDPRFTQRWSKTPFGDGHHRRAMDVVVGVYEGMPCAAFIYQYTTGSGNNRRTTVLDVTTLALPAVLPALAVQPESVVGELAPGLLPGEVDLENETFDRRYRVRATDPKFASDVLPPRTMEALLSVEPFAWRIDGRDLVAWGPPTGDAGTVLSRLDVLATVARNLPQFVWQDRSRPV